MDKIGNIIRQDNLTTATSLMDVVESKSRTLSSYFENLAESILCSTPKETKDILDLRGRFSTNLEDVCKETTKVIQQLAADNPAFSSQLVTQFNGFLRDSEEKVQKHGMEWHAEMQKMATDKAIQLNGPIDCSTTICQGDSDELNESNELALESKKATDLTLSMIRSLYIKV